LQRKERGNMGVLRRLVIIVLIELTALCITAAYRWVDLQSTAVLIIFNLLFASLFLKLNGDLPIKLTLLAAGNATGVIWNYCFHQLMFTAADAQIFSSTSLNTFYTIAYPFLNSFWVIAFWAVSLTALHPRKRFERNLAI
jgi:hypothetical protein